MLEGGVGISGRLKCNSWGNLDVRLYRSLNFAIQPFGFTAAVFMIFPCPIDFAVKHPSVDIVASNHGTDD